MRIAEEPHLWQIIREALIKTLIYSNNSHILQYSNTPILQYSNTPILQYSNTPILQYSNTPILQYSNTPILQYSNTPILQYSNTPILQYSNKIIAIIFNGQYLTISLIFCCCFTVFYCFLLFLIVFLEFWAVLSC